MVIRVQIHSIFFLVMNLFKVFLPVLLFPTLSESSSYGEKLDLILVNSIVEVPGDGRTLIKLKEYPQRIWVDELTEEKRFRLCEEGQQLLFNLKPNERIEFQNDINVDQFQTKAYVIIDDQSEGKGKIVTAYKCPTTPFTYIQFNLNYKTNTKDTKFFVIFKALSSSPKLVEVINYDMEIAHKITEVDVTTLESVSFYEFGRASNAYDAERWLDEERLEMCERSMQHIILGVPTGLDIQFLENSVIGKVNYYSLVIKIKHEVSAEIIKGFHCPTEPKILVYVVDSKKNKGPVVKGIVERCKIKRSGVTLPEDQTVKRLSWNTFTPDQVIERLSASFLTKGEQFFRARKESEHFPRKPDIDSETKNRICLSILSNSRYSKPIDMSTVPEEMYSKYPDLFEMQLEIDEHAFSNFIPIYKTTNPTKSIEVYIDDKDQQPILENVFSCLARWEDDKRKVRHEKYFVSEEYNMNHASDSSINYIAGRFLFYEDADDDNRVKLYSVAEEPARAVLEPDSLFKNVELLYLQSCSTRQPAEYESEDPICQLNEKQKFKLCGLIFTSEYYDGKVRFPTTAYVVGDNKCHRNTISFRNEDVRTMTDGEEYEEWMVICYLSHSPYHYRTYFSLEYFVSTAYNDSDPSAMSANDVFVYQWKSNGYYLQNSFTNIRLH